MKNSQQVVLVENTINLFLDFLPLHSQSRLLCYATRPNAYYRTLTRGRADGQTDAMTSLHHVTSAGINSGRRAWIERRGDRCVQCGGTEWMRRRGAGCQPTGRTDGRTPNITCHDDDDIVVASTGKVRGASI